jgi:hypothetical protein
MMDEHGDLVEAYRRSPPLYPDAINLDSSSKRTNHSFDSDILGGRFTCMYIKLSFRPRIHLLLVLRQFEQSGSPSSHLRCLPLHVRQPVRVLLDLTAIGAEPPKAAGRQ